MSEITPALSVSMSNVENQNFYQRFAATIERFSFLEDQAQPNCCGPCASVIPRHSAATSAYSAKRPRQDRPARLHPGLRCVPAEPCADSLGSIWAACCSGAFTLVTRSQNSFAICPKAMLASALLSDDNGRNGRAITKDVGTHHD